MFFVKYCYEQHSSLGRGLKFAAEKKTFVEERSTWFLSQVLCNYLVAAEAHEGDFKLTLTLKDTEI